MKTPSAVTRLMPAMTAVPRIRREAAPAPAAVQSGTHPRMKAKEVMRMGRSRSLAPSSAAATRSFPSCSCCILANSTIRMAFFAARPMSITRPICP